MSDDEETINPVAHKQLLNVISSLGKTQHIRKPTRNEPTLQHDEFHLIKSRATELKSEQPIAIKDLVSILKNTKEHVNIGNKLRNVARTKKVLKKPLEKPVAERIKRSLGYQNIKRKLSRWDALVTKNRNAEQQIFPLKSETIYINTSGRGKKDLAIKSDLMKQMEETNKKLAALKRQQNGDMTDPVELEEKERVLLEQQLTREELKAKRKELAYIKMKQSEKSARARLQNKIKSKKYHKLLKRQKLQQQLKEFELLQKTNPEAALEKLNALEKARALERASLRHRNTGTWAKNLQIRAKYDKEVRKDLADQLQKSRELTEKVKDMQSDDDEDDSNDEIINNDHIVEEEEVDPSNPWIKVNKKSKSACNGGEELGNWRKFWLERNTNEKLLEEYKKLLHEENVLEKEETLNEKPVQLGDGKNEQEVVHPVVPEAQKGIDTTYETAPLKKEKGKRKANRKINKNKVETRSKRKSFWENGWLVEEIDPIEENKKAEVDVDVKMEYVEKTLDNIFDEGEERVREKLQEQLKKLNEEARNFNEQKNFKANGFDMREQESDPLKNLKDLSFQQNESKRPIIDEELIIDDLEVENRCNDKSKEKLLSIQRTPLIKPNDQENGDPQQQHEKDEESKNCNSSNTEDHIDPNKFVALKLTHNHHLNDLSTINDAIGEVDVDYDGDADEDDEEYIKQQRLTIAEAFEDDDIIADFNKEKAEESQLKNTELDLSMPGWGNWAGPGLSTTEQQISANKRKRLIFKLPTPEKRRDENKSNVYINEETSKELRQHLVSDVPFPFTRQEDYEASVRAPIGRDFVTETSFRLLTRPSIITRKGQIIEPMDDSELIKKPRKFKNPVDFRIAQLNKAI